MMFSISLTRVKVYAPNIGRLIQQRLTNECKILGNSPAFEISTAGNSKSLKILSPEYYKHRECPHYWTAMQYFNPGAAIGCLKLLKHIVVVWM